MPNENLTNQNNDTETQAQDPYDALFKQVMTDLFSKLQIPMKTEQEVSRKPRTIDVIITGTEKDRQKASLETPFNFFEINNIIAFKSVTDPLKISEYHKIVARAHFYMAENGLATPDTIIVAVCSSEPRKVLRHSQEEVEFRMITTWHYVSNEKLPFHVIIIRKLEMEFKNYPLLLFAPMRKFKEFVKHAVENNRLRYLEYAYILHPKETKEVLMMTGNIPIPEENVEFIVKDLTPERILRHINLKDIPEENVEFIVKDLTPERILRYIDAEDRLSGVDVKDRLRGLDVEDIAQNLSDEEKKELQKLLNGKNE